MLGPFPTSAVIDRLRALPVLKLVGTATDLQSALTKAPAVTPAAYVAVQESATPPKGFAGGVMVQEVQASVQVVLFVTSYAGAGADAQLQMDTVVVPAVRAALLAWEPSAGITQMSLQAFRTERYTAPYLVAQEIYQSGYRIQANP